MLVEVMLVVGIIAIISSVSWLALSNSKKNVDAGNACTQIAGYINKTRNYVVSGKTNWATFRILNNSEVSVALAGMGAPEMYKLKGEVSCNNIVIDYIAPNAVGTFSGNIICSGASGISKVIEVTPYQAVCK